MPNNPIASSKRCLWRNQVFELDGIASVSLSQYYLDSVAVSDWQVIGHYEALIDSNDRLWLLTKREGRVLTFSRTKEAEPLADTPSH